MSVQKVFMAPCPGGATPGPVPGSASPFFPPCTQLPGPSFAKCLLHGNSMSPPGVCFPVTQWVLPSLSTLLQSICEIDAAPVTSRTRGTVVTTLAMSIWPVPRTPCCQVCACSGSRQSPCHHGAPALGTGEISHDRDEMSGAESARG